MNLTEAIMSLYPRASWSMDQDDYETLWWAETNEDPKPTKQELKKEITKLKRQATKKQYINNRKEAYPSIEEQLDMLWHAIDDGHILGKNSTWYRTILDVKDSFPKA